MKSIIMICLIIALILCCIALLLAVLDLVVTVAERITDFIRQKKITRKVESLCKSSSRTGR